MNISGFINSMKRIFIVSKKPTWNEFSTMAKVTGIGIIIVGLIGFFIMLVFQLTGIGF